MQRYLGTVAHCLITLALGIVGLAWIAAGFYVGREIAQAEYRYIEANGGKRYACPWYCGFLSSAWNLKSVLDWGLPMLIATGFALLA